MIKRQLVTTALENTWPVDGTPVLFLGEWCRLFNRKSTWKQIESIVAPYHWDDRDKLHRDYLYIQVLYEALLIELAEKLNFIHSKNHSIRYWRILVGPWLGFFIQILFDRWSMLRQVFNDSDNLSVCVIKHQNGEGIPNNMEDFVEDFDKDSWNELIYAQVLDWMKIPVVRIDVTNRLNTTKKIVKSAGILHQFKSSSVQFATQVSGAICREDEYFFISSYLSVKDEMCLQAKLGQIPKIWRSVATPKSQVNLLARQWELPILDDNAEFSKLVRSIISKHIPTTYLEGYKKLEEISANLPWTKKPKAIFTSNLHFFDDVFKIWAADKVEQNVPLIIGQHGGAYGVMSRTFYEEHEIAIADRYLTWGWCEPNLTSVLPVGNFKNFSKSSDTDKAGDALLVGVAYPRMSYVMASMPMSAGQWQIYFDEQCLFIQSLPEKLRKKILVRPYSKDYQLFQKERWQERYPEVKLDEGIQSMTGLMKKIRLYISTYNATTYLESMSLNFPTIIFWNPKYWELRESAIPYFEMLKTVGIFHDTPKSAAKHMTGVWDDIDDWWQSRTVQTIRREFCERYARVPEKPLNIMTNLFREISKHHHNS